MRLSRIEVTGLLVMIASLLCGCNEKSDPINDNGESFKLELDYKDALAEPETSSAADLFIASGDALSKDKLEEAGFLFYAAQLRVRFDKECFPPIGQGGDSPITLFGALSHQLGASINPAIMGDPVVFAGAIKRLKSWTPRAPNDYDPGYRFQERLTEEAALTATESGRHEFKSQFENLSKLLNMPDYFSAFRIHQKYNMTFDESRPSEEASQKAVAVMKAIEERESIKGFISMNEGR